MNDKIGREGMSQSLLIYICFAYKLDTAIVRVILYMTVKCNNIEAGYQINCVLRCRAVFFCFVIILFIVAKIFKFLRRYENTRVNVFMVL